MADENKEQQRREKSERDLAEHDRTVARNASHAARDVLHDASAGQEPGAYTVQEARDRAAHTPSVLDKDAPANREEEARMLDALHREHFPTQETWDRYQRMQDPERPPNEKEARQQWDDFKRMTPQENTTKESNSFMTPEQQASVDKALQSMDRNDRISGANDVSNRPEPNDPTPLDKSRDIGQDLQKQGVTLDKE